MKKLIYFTLIFLILTSAALCAADAPALTWRFADADEAAELLLSNRGYYDNLSQNDLNFRMQKMDATLAELEAYTAEQTRDWTEAEKDAVISAMEMIGSICEERGYTLPPTEDIVFAKTTMKEECNAGAYTHGTQIYLGERMLSYGLNEDPVLQEYFREVVAHELFHCLTRNHPDFRAAMYGILGFTVVEEDYEFSPEIRDIIISNPDVGHHNSYAAFDIDGEMKDCVVIFTTAEPFRKPGDSFFKSMETGLVPVDDTGVFYSSEEAENFWEVFGENTEYVIDPEETLADNFAITMLYGTEEDYKTPEIILAIDEMLKNEEF